MAEITDADREAAAALWDQLFNETFSRHHAIEILRQALAAEREATEAAIVAWLKGPGFYQTGNIAADAIAARAHHKGTHS